MGFKQGEKFHYDQLILDGDFKLYVTVQSKQVHFWLVDLRRQATTMCSFIWTRWLVNMLAKSEKLASRP